MQRFISFQSFVLLIFCLVTCLSIQAQVQFPSTGSAIIEVNTSNKGILTPRMTLAQREAIANPAVGLLVYQTDGVEGFYFYGGSAWRMMGSVTALIQDSDGNTKVQVEKNANENIIRFDISGQEKFTLKKSNMHDINMSFVNNNENIFIGHHAGNNTTNAKNIAIGDSTFMNNITGYDNLAIGKKALFNNVNGSYNFAIGQEALFNNTVDSNMAVGKYALKNNTLGKLNTGIGTSTLQNNQSGNYNLAIGLNALLANTAGSNNTAVGEASLSANIDGTDNTVIGNQSMRHNITGSQNTVVSTPFAGNTRTLSNNIDGYQNTALGSYVLDNAASAYQTTAFAIDALDDLTTGIGNTALGETVLQNLTTGENNVAIGNTVMNPLTTGSRNVALGKYIFYAVNNPPLSLSSSSNNVFIGGSEDDAYLIGSANTAIGTFSSLNNEYNTAIGYSAEMSSNTNYSTAIGARIKATDPGFSDGIVLLSNNQNSRIGIGTSNPHVSAILDINANDRGLLLPKLTDAQMRSIPTPKNGLMVYNTTYKSIFTYNFYAGSISKWKDQNNFFDFNSNAYASYTNKTPVYKNTGWIWGGTDHLEDSDGNTRIQIEKNPNEDKFRLRLNDEEKFVINRSPFSQIYYETFSNSQSVYLGNNAGANADLSMNNIGIGYNTMNKLNTANGNTGIGSSVLINNVNGEENTVIGFSAMTDNVAGSYNTAIGANALDMNSTGLYNTAIGINAMNDITNGQYNTAIGYDAEVLGSGISYATALGYKARATESNTFIIGAINGVNGATKTAKVGMGASSPAARLHVKRDSMGSFDPIMRLESESDDFTRIRFKNINSSNEWSIQAKSDGTIAYGRFNFFYTQNILSFHADGDAVLTGSLLQLSDKRLKKNIKPIKIDWNKLSDIKAYNYHWADTLANQRLQLGFIAQQVEQHFPSLVIHSEKSKSVNYQGFIPIIIEGIKSIDTESAVIKNDLEKNRHAINQLREELNALQSSIKNAKRR